MEWDMASQNMTTTCVKELRTCSIQRQQSRYEVLRLFIQNVEKCDCVRDEHAYKTISVQQKSVQKMVGSIVRNGVLSQYTHGLNRYPPTFLNIYKSTGSAYIQ